MTHTTAVGDVQDEVPLNPLQEGLWLFWTLNPEVSAYAMPEVFRYEGDFDLDALRRAYALLLARHDGLRTRFEERETGVFQVIYRPAEAADAVVLIDLREVPPTDRAAQVDQTVAEESNRPFDLATGPAVRLSAVRVEDHDTVIVLVAHHIVCDGLSMAVLLDELGELYRAQCERREARLSSATVGYPAFTRSQLTALGNGDFEEAQTFWSNRLAGARGSALPGGPPSGEGFATTVESLELRAEVARSVIDYAREAGTTPYGVLLTAMDILVAIAAENSDVVLAGAVSTRPAEFATTIGMMVNTIVLRSQIDLTKSFAQVQGTVAFDLLDSLEHVDLPFSRVVAEHGPGRADELLRTMFVAGTNGGLSLGQGATSADPASTVDGPLDLITICYVEAEQVAIDWEFARSRYSAEAIAGYPLAFGQLLAEVLRDVHAPLDQLGLADIVCRAVPQVRSQPAAVQGRTATGGAELSAEEKQVATIWRELLDVSEVGPDSDFFELGGHSMVASQAVAAVRSRLSAPVKLRTLFDYPRLRDFCDQIPKGGDTVGAAR